MTGEVLIRRPCQRLLAVGILATCAVACAGFARTPRAEPDLETLGNIEPAEGYGISTDYTRLRLFDPEHRPVAGAKAGPTAMVRVDMPGDVLKWPSVTTSNARGEVILGMRSILEAGPGQDRCAVYILHEDRKLGALRMLTKADAGKISNVHLSPVCQVHGTLASPALEAQAMPLWTTTTTVLWHGSPILRSTSQNPSFQFLLPPGDYTFTFDGMGGRTSRRMPVPFVVAEAGEELRSREVPDDSSDMDLATTELQPTGPSAMIGQPAPELGPIRAWTKASPVTLAELRGWPVVLHFGGNSPHPRDVTKLVELQNTFGPRDLIIIAIYNCASMEELEQKWTGLGQQSGIGDLPLRVAIDGQEPSDPNDTNKAGPGATHRRYGVGPGFRTVLIDVMGRIAGEINLNSGIDPKGEGRNAIREALGIPREAAAAKERATERGRGENRE